MRGGGGKTGDFLSEHGMIEHRIAAIQKRAYQLEPFPPKGKAKFGTVSASFKAVRKQVCEHVQLLSREELKAFLGCLGKRGSSSRGATTSHLLTMQAMAARSPAVLWSFAHEFDGDVETGVEVLKAELLG